MKLSEIHPLVPPPSGYGLPPSSSSPFKVVSFTPGQVGRGLEPQILLAGLCPFGHSLETHTAHAQSHLLREGVV